MRRLRQAWLVAAALAMTLAAGGCAVRDATPAATPTEHPCGRQVDPATARVVDVYVAVLGHLVGQRDHGGPGAKVLYLVDHAVPEFHETGIPEHERQTPAPASDSTERFSAPVRRCLEAASFDGLPPIRLVTGFEDPAVRTEPVPLGGWPSDLERPRRIVDGRLFSLGGVPAGGDRLALAASSLGGENDATGALFVLAWDGASWRVTGQERWWVT